MKTTLQVSNILAFLITLVFNYLSNTGIFNGNTMGSVSADYQNLFTPAGYAFSIWGLIYIGLTGFVIYQARSLFRKNNNKEPDNFVLLIGWWFVISCLANSLWVLAWLYGYTGLSVVIMILLLFSLLKIVINTRMELDEVSLKTLLLVWWPFSIYSGWVSVALIANTAAWLTKIGWDGFGLSDVAWTIIMICVAGAINIYITWKRNMREFTLAGIWALIAIAVANWKSELPVVNAALMMALVIFISTSIHAFMNRKNLFRGLKL